MHVDYGQKRYIIVFNSNTTIDDLTGFAAYIWETASQLRDALRKDKAMLKDLVMVRWIPRYDGFVKLSKDGAAHGNFGFVGAGVLITFDIRGKDHWVQSLLKSVLKHSG